MGRPKAEKNSRSIPSVPWARDQRAEQKVPLMLILLIGSLLSGGLFWYLGQAGKFSFKRPWALLLLTALPLAYWILFRLRPRRIATFNHSVGSFLKRMRPGGAARLSSLPRVLRFMALALIIIALAQPQTRDRGGRVDVAGIDIVIALDMSNSMEAIDLQPNRLEAAKKVVDEFISRRKSDKIGLVTFGRQAFTYCPLTLDYSALRNMLGNLQLGMIDGTATAIGNALGVSLARLRTSDAKSRVVILLTDGDNNAGNVPPTQSARYARAMNVKVFTILMGAKEGDVIAGKDLFGRPIRVKQKYPANPKLLEKIAKMTNGKAYLATDTEALEHNFESILNELDKSMRKDVAAVYNDAFRPFVALALLLLGLEAVLMITRYRQFP